MNKYIIDNEGKVEEINGLVLTAGHVLKNPFK